MHQDFLQKQVISLRWSGKILAGSVAQLQKVQMEHTWYAAITKLAMFQTQDSSKQMFARQLVAQCREIDKRNN